MECLIKNNVHIVVDFIISLTIEKCSTAYCRIFMQVIHGKIYFLILAVVVLYIDGLTYCKKSGLG